MRVPVCFTLVLIFSPHYSPALSKDLFASVQTPYLRTLSILSCFLSGLCSILEPPYNSFVQCFFQNPWCILTHFGKAGNPELIHEEVQLIRAERVNPCNASRR